MGDQTRKATQDIVNFAIKLKRISSLTWDAFVECVGFDMAV